MLARISCKRIHRTSHCLSSTSTCTIVPFEGVWNHGVGQTRLLVRQAAVLDVEVGVEERGALRPEEGSAGP